MSAQPKKQCKYNALYVILRTHLPFHASRVKFILLLVLSLIKVQSVCFVRLASGFDNPVLLGSNVRRIQRFFAQYVLEGKWISLLLFKMLPHQSRYGLTLDRTNWKLGCVNINILMLGVVYEGVAYPLLWTFLGNKRGNSDQQVRIELLKRFIDWFGIACIDYVVADREFVGEQWWAFLITHHIRFFMRIRENMHVQIAKNKVVKAHWLFNRWAPEVKYQYPRLVQINRNWVYLTGMKYYNTQGRLEYLIVASWDKAHNALDIYKQRWQIETMFRAFKTAGFNLEDTHLTDYQRLDKLLMLTAIAFHWAYNTGIYEHKNTKKLKKKKHGRMEKSFFAYGLHQLTFALINQTKRIPKKFIQTFLSGT